MNALLNILFYAARYIDYIRKSLLMNCTFPMRYGNQFNITTEKFLRYSHLVSIQNKLRLMKHIRW